MTTGRLEMTHWVLFPLVCSPLKADLYSSVGRMGLESSLGKCRTLEFGKWTNQRCNDRQFSDYSRSDYRWCRLTKSCSLAVVNIEDAISTCVFLLKNLICVNFSKPKYISQIYTNDIFRSVNLCKIENIPNILSRRNQSYRSPSRNVSNEALRASSVI